MDRGYTAIEKERPSESNQESKALMKDTGGLGPWIFLYK
jgi:hypothetical protein